MQCSSCSALTEERLFFFCVVLRTDLFDFTGIFRRPFLKMSKMNLIVLVLTFWCRMYQGKQIFSVRMTSFGNIMVDTFWSIWVTWVYVLIIRLAILSGRNFNIGHYTQTFQPNFFIPAMLIGTTDFYHIILLSVTLTLAWGCKVSTKQNLLASFSRTLCNWSGWNLVWCWSSSSWKPWCYYFWLRFTETRERMVVLLIA